MTAIVMGKFRVFGMLDGSVGEEGLNFYQDVCVVQELLSQWELLGRYVKGICCPFTIKAIKVFQADCVMLEPTGLIRPEKETWQRLIDRYTFWRVGSRSVGRLMPAIPAGFAEPNFPLAVKPRMDWITGQRRYGADRPNQRAHAGCDLYHEEGTPVYAVMDGIVLEITSFLTSEPNIKAVSVAHSEFIARYTEVKNVIVHQGQLVRAGQKLAELAHISGVANAMLHFEMYKGNLSGPFRKHPGGKMIGQRSSQRRHDLMDPTKYLNLWVEKLAVPSD